MTATQLNLIIIAIGGITIYLVLIIVSKIIYLSEYFTMFNNSILFGSLAAGIIGMTWCGKDILKELKRQAKAVEK